MILPMDSTSTRKQVTHDRILDTAAVALRGAGFGGVGVADVMRQAGLTHGGFYAHFPSRDALLAEALERAGEDSGMRVRQAIEKGRARGLSAFRSLVESYLSERHLNAPEAGCPVAALATEMPRQAECVRDAGANGVRALTASVQAVLPAKEPPDSAAVVTAQLVGALQLARALGDNPQGRRQLAASRRFLLEQFDSPARPAGR